MQIEIVAECLVEVRQYAADMTNTEGPTRRGAKHAWTALATR
jgi:hypothetical protein